MSPIDAMGYGALVIGGVLLLGAVMRLRGGGR